MITVTFNYNEQAKQTELTCNEIGVVFRLSQVLSNYGICKGKKTGSNHVLIVKAKLTTDQVQAAINEQLNPEVVKLKTE